MTRSSKRDRRILRPAHRIALVAVLVSLFVGASSTAAFALWSASGTTGSSITVGKVATSLNGASALATTFSSSSTTATAPVTFANTGTVAATYSSVASVTSGSAALAKAITVVAWPVSAASACTSTGSVGAGSVTGTWASLPSFSGSLAPSASAVWCLRSTASPAAPAQTTVTPSLALTVTAGTWTATSAATFTLTTASSTPAFTCTDYDGNWHLLVTWDASTRPLATYYGVFINGTMIGPSQQGYNGKSDLSASQVSTSTAPDGVARVNVTVLDSAMNPTTTIAATGTVTLFAQQGTRAVKCGG